MADPAKHITQWKHNRAFLNSVPPAYSDWIVTVTFYVALHAVDSLLEFDNVDRVHSHETRNRVLTAPTAIWPFGGPTSRSMICPEKSVIWPTRNSGCRPT